MYLVDTSGWIDFLRGTDVAQVTALTEPPKRGPAISSGTGAFHLAAELFKDMARVDIVVAKLVRGMSWAVRMRMSA